MDRFFFSFIAEAVAGYFLRFYLRLAEYGCVLLECFLSLSSSPSAVCLCKTMVNGGVHIWQRSLLAKNKTIFPTYLYFRLLTWHSIDVHSTDSFFYERRPCISRAACTGTPRAATAKAKEKKRDDQIDYDLLSSIASTGQMNSLLFNVAMASAVHDIYLCA